MYKFQCSTFPDERVVSLSSNFCFALAPEESPSGYIHYRGLRQLNV